MRHFAQMLLAVCYVVCVSGCGPTVEEEASNRFIKSAKVTVNPGILNDYTGTYALPSGVLFKVSLEENQLMAGDPPYELLPQTTREFASNRIFAKIIFDRDDSDRVQQVNIQAAKQEMWAQRVDPASAKDPTQMVDAGGHRLRMLVSGTGGPTIIIEDGFGSSILMRSMLQAELSKFARVITYDHAGTGGSEAGPNPRHAGQIAGELRIALKNADIPTPYVMVGGSIGADYISVFAHKYPEDVAGLVWLDPTPDWEALHDWMKLNAPSRAKSFRKIYLHGISSIPDLMKHQELGRLAEWGAIEETREQARNSLPLPNIPVVQITGAAGHQTIQAASDKVKFFDSWLKINIPQAKHVLAKNSRHAIFATDSELVIDEIQLLIDSIRQKQGPITESESL